MANQMHLNKWKSVMSTVKVKETFAFHPDISRTLDIIVNTSGTEKVKDRFLSEIVLWSAKIGKLAGYPESGIEIVPDVLGRTLTITDPSEGMTLKGLFDNYGGSAHSGSRQLVQTYDDGLELFNFSSLDAYMKAFKPELFIRYGVGFYTAFFVADKVTVTTRKGDQQYVWEAIPGAGFPLPTQRTFTIKEDSGDRIEGGTKVVLYMKEECVKFLEKKELIRIAKYLKVIEGRSICFHWSKPMSNLHLPELHLCLHDSSCWVNDKKEVINVIPMESVEYFEGKKDDENVIRMRPIECYESKKDDDKKEVINVIPMASVEYFEGKTDDENVIQMPPLEYYTGRRNDDENVIQMRPIECYMSKNFRS